MALYKRVETQREQRKPPEIKGDRELNIAVHEKVFGKLYPRIIFQMKRGDAPNFKMRYINNAPDFSGDMKLAMAAVDKAFDEWDERLQRGEVGGNLELEMHYEVGSRKWLSFIVDHAIPDGEDLRHGVGDTAEEAICRCLLEFVK